MILSIDFNPLLKRKYSLTGLELKQDNIPHNVIYGPGGDGIELGYLLHGLNERVVLTGFLGGPNGSHIHRMLESSGIPHNYVQIRDESKDNIILSLEKGDEIVIKEKDTRITREEIVSFYQLYSETVKDAEIICCLGELPVNASEETFYDIISMGNKYGKKSILACKGPSLIYGIEAAPYMVLLNKEDLEGITKLSLNYEYEIIKAGLYVLEKGVSFLVIELGDKGSIVLTQEQVYRVEAPKGEKDYCKINYGYMVAGFAVSIQRNHDIDTLLKLGQACGIVNCFKHSDNVDMSDIKRIISDIEVSTFNY